MAAGHILRMTKGRPFVQLKMAVSGDGLIAPGDGAPVLGHGPGGPAVRAPPAGARRRHPGRPQDGRRRRPRAHLPPAGPGRALAAPRRPRRQVPHAADGQDVPDRARRCRSSSSATRTSHAAGLPHGRRGAAHAAGPDGRLEPRGRAGEPGRRGRHARAGRGRADHCGRLPARPIWSTRSVIGAAPSRSAPRAASPSATGASSFSSDAGRWQHGRRAPDRRRPPVDPPPSGRFAAEPPRMTDAVPLLPARALPGMRRPARGVQRALRRLYRSGLLRVPARRPAAARGRLDGTFESQTVRQVVEWKASGPLRRRARGVGACRPARHHLVRA